MLICLPYPAALDDGSVSHDFDNVSSPASLGSLVSLKYRHGPLSIRPLFSKIFFSKTAGPIEAKFHWEPPWVRGAKVCLGHLGHMTKMAAMPIYGKNPSKIFS